MEYGTGLTILGTAIGSAKLVEKVLGPTADYIGGGIKNWTEKRVNNVGRIFTKAARRLGPQLEENGAVPPKVLKGILDEGSFCDDELSAEYFGGVLASSRSGMPRDDRGATYIALLGRLSTYQIRSHYIFYHILKNLLNGLAITWVELMRYPSKLEAIIPLEIYEQAMAFSAGEDVRILYPHIANGLMKEFLIHERLKGGGFLSKEGLGLEDFALGIQPTILGIELFLWAYGKPNMRYEEFFNQEQQFELAEGVTILSGYHRIVYASPTSIDTKIASKTGNIK